MDLPLRVGSKCIASDEECYANIRSALTRGLPEIRQQEPPGNGDVAIVGSAPSVAGEIESLRRMRELRIPIVAIRDAHDWLISQGIVPDYALSVDPSEPAAECFKNPHKDVCYLPASQSHPKMLDYLVRAKPKPQVTLWHAHIHGDKEDPRAPKIKFWIGGSTTSGLRAIVVFYVLGFRTFHLFGMDSCLSGNNLRVNGTSLDPNDQSFRVTLPSGESYMTNPRMAQQAITFQNCYEHLPDATFIGYGQGLLQGIIRQRARDYEELQRLTPVPENDRVSFIHSGGPDMASYRYRAMIPALEMGASINDLTASTLIFAKPQAAELMQMSRAIRQGQRVIVDFCDDHFEWMHYTEALRIADAVTCPTEELAKRIKEVCGREATVIPDPYEYPEEAPHCDGGKLLWFGHETNRPSLQRVMPDLYEYPLRIVSNFPGSIPWSVATMLEEFKRADIVIIPATEAYKSANRAVEAIRQGCFVVAEPHPALNDIPGIWIGNIKKGIEWAKHYSLEARQALSSSQSHVREKYAPKIVTAMWKKLTERPTTSEAETSIGLVGSMST